MTYLDLNTWNRKELFHFFKNFDQPFFNICAQVDVTHVKTEAKKRGYSFFLVSLFLSTKAANEILPFRYRLRGDRVWVHDRIHLGSTILNDDQTFGFCYFDYASDFRCFYDAASANLDAYKRGQPPLSPEDYRDDLIHYSVIPWIAFTSFQHARTRIENESVPRITFGKYIEGNGRILMPVSVEVHHALMDGYHVGHYFEKLETLFAETPDGF